MLDILLVDDEPDFRTVVGEALRDAGHRVSLAANGAEGLSLISSNVFDVMICDIRLPKVDGLTLFRRVRQESPGTDVILITAHAAVSDAVAALKEGPYDYITKPFDVDEIILQMERIAAQRRDGGFKAAGGGTLLLDEIAEVPLPAQAKLLRVLQEGTVEPLGTNESTRVDVRIISATHRNLRERIKEGRFREDLYYRLNVLDIEIPPLRERRGDMPLLLQYFLNKFTQPGKTPSTIS